jgi:hypothetical protein
VPFKQRNTENKLKFLKLSIPMISFSCRLSATVKQSRQPDSESWMSEFTSD